MRYNEKYDRWVTNGGLVYRYNSKRDILVLCKPTLNHTGYLQLTISKLKRVILIHRLVFETFVGEIPNGMEIDHKNTIRTDNRLENLRCVTHKDNLNNSLTIIHFGESNKGRPKVRLGKTFSEFGRKFKEHFGITRSENIKLYDRELKWYTNHNNMCRWENE